MNAPPKPRDARELPGVASPSSTGTPPSESMPVSTKHSTRAHPKRERKRRPKFVL
jgi:hypothetical protein